MLRERGAAERRRAHRRRRARRRPGRLVLDGRAASTRSGCACSLNALLPPDIAVSRVAPAPAGFDARAGRRAHLSLPRSGCRRRGPCFERAYVWDVRGALDADAAAPRPRRCSSGRRDFAALTPSARLYRTCVREVRRAAWRRRPTAARLRFEITAGSFLHNMVRVAVGSMVDVAQGRMSLSELAAPASTGGGAARWAARRRRAAWRWCAVEYESTGRLTRVERAARAPAEVRVSGSGSARTSCERAGSTTT